MAQMFRSGLYIYAIMQRNKDEPNLTKAANLPKILQAQLCLTHDKFRKKNSHNGISLCTSSNRAP